MQNFDGYRKGYVFNIKLLCDGVKLDKDYEFTLNYGDYAVYDLNPHINVKPEWPNSEYLIEAMSRMVVGENTGARGVAKLHT